jgi:hypothetical protein
MNARQSLLAAGSVEDRSRSVPLSRSRVVRLELALAGILLGTALVWDWIRGLGLWTDLRGSATDALLGLCGALALCLSLPFLMSPWASEKLGLRGLKNVWDDVLAPLGKSLSLGEILLLAGLSGISEEVFFRGVLQQEIGILAASLLFGLLHPINASYVAWAASVGLAFGTLYRATGSLVAPVLCHGGYNLAVLLYLRYWHQVEHRDEVLLAG